MVQTSFHIQVHTAVASGHVQVGNSLSSSKTPIIILQVQAIEKKQNSTN